MSTVDVSFKAQIKVGDQIVPIATEVVDSSDSSTGVNKGFLFKLDLAPFQAPVSVYLGDIVDFIENKLGAGAGSLAGNSNISAVSQVIPSLSANNFKSGDQTMLDVYEFSINSSTQSFLFSFNLDVLSANPAGGLINLPSEFSQWLKIENISITFSASGQ